MEAKPGALPPLFPSRAPGGASSLEGPQGQALFLGVWILSVSAITGVKFAPSRLKTLHLKDRKSGPPLKKVKKRNRNPPSRALHSLGLNTGPRRSFPLFSQLAGPVPGRS